MAERSIEITLVNTTGQILTFQSNPSSIRGSWISPPPATVEKEAIFAAEVVGLEPGIQGTVVYQIGGTQNQTVSLSFESPFVGSDTFTATCTPASAFRCAVAPDGGTNATVTYTLSAV